MKTTKDKQPIRESAGQVLSFAIVFESDKCKVFVELKHWKDKVVMSSKDTNRDNMVNLNQYCIVPFPLTIYEYFSGFSTDCINTKNAW